VRRGARTVHGKDKGRGEDGATVMGHPLFIPVQRRRQRRWLGHEGEPCGGKEDEGGGLVRQSGDGSWWAGTRERWLRVGGDFGVSYGRVSARTVEGRAADEWARGHCTGAVAV
jgi:hypothetical protein